MSSFVELKKRVPVKLDTPLAHSFGFDFGDLQDNQAGYISHWQKKRLRWHLLSYTISILTWIFIATVFPLGIFYVIFGSILEHAALPYLWIGCVLAVFGMFWFWKMKTVWLDMQGGKVSELIGEVYKHKTLRKQRVKLGDEIYEHHEHDHYIWVGNERFDVSDQQLKSFRDGVLYKLYVATESRQILSAELLNQSQNDTVMGFLFERDDVSLDTRSDDIDDSLTHKKRKQA